MPHIAGHPAPAPVYNHWWEDPAEDRGFGYAADAVLGGLKGAGSAIKNSFTPTPSDFGRLNQHVSTEGEGTPFVGTDALGEIYGDFAANAGVEGPVWEGGLPGGSVGLPGNPLQNTTYDPWNIYGRAWDSMTGGFGALGDAVTADMWKPERRSDDLGPMLNQYVTTQGEGTPLVGNEYSYTNPGEVLGEALGTPDWLAAPQPVNPTLRQQQHAQGVREQQGQQGAFGGEGQPSFPCRARRFAP